VLIADATNGAVTAMRTMAAVTPETFMAACADAAGLAPGFKPASR
jgi:hypothetical protein